MKRKFLQNSIVVTTLAMTLCLSAVVLVTSCQKQKFEDELALSESSQTKATLPYIEFSTGYTGIGQASDRDWKVIMEVLKRVKIQKVEGLWSLNINSAAEINVSPEIFTFLTQTIENKNASLLANFKVRSIVPRQLKPGESGDSNDPRTFNCVPGCIGYIATNKGFGPSYDSAYNSMMERYGMGVPSDSMGPFLRDMYGRDKVFSFPVNSQPHGSWYNDSNSAVILNYHPDGDSTAGHAIIYKGTSADGTHWGDDPQNGGQPAFVDSVEVIDAYKVTK